MFSPACLNASAAVHSAVTQVKKCSEQIFQGNVTLLWKDKHKPFKVGFDIAKMAGLHESDSRIAFRTFALLKPL